MKNEQDQLSLKEIAWTFFAGGMTRWGELPVGHVFERIRVWINTNPQKSAPVQTIYNEGGLKTFYRGIFWNAAPATLKTGIRWVNVTVADKVVSNYISKEHTTVKATLIGVMSSAVTTTALCPFERLKVNAMTNISSKSRFNFDIFYSLMKGWRPMFVKQATISTIFNVTYTHLLKLAQNSYYPAPLQTYHLAMIGASAGAICAVITTPIDMVKDQMQMHQGLKEKRLIPATTELYQRYGFFSMVKAMPVKVARSAWYFGVTTLLMDKFKALPKFMRPEVKDENPSSDSASSSKMKP